MDLQKSLNLNIASYFIITLESPHADTWHHSGGPITHTIDNFCLNPNNEQSVDHTQITVISYIEKVVKYTGINVSKIMVDLTFYLLLMKYICLKIQCKKRLGLRYTTLLINCNYHTHDNNAVSRSTVNLAFRRLQPKI